MDIENLKNELNIVSVKLGKAPRKFSFWDKLTWMHMLDLYHKWEDDELQLITKNWRNLFTHGKLAWGHIIQANSMLFEEGWENLPGEVLVWTNTESIDFSRLEKSAHYLYSLRTQITNLKDQEKLFIGKYLEDQLTRVFGHQVPSQMYNADNLFISTTYFVRKHLPHTTIDTPFFPVLYLEQAPKLVTVVPYRFWSEKFLKFWIEE